MRKIVSVLTVINTLALGVVIYFMVSSRDRIAYVDSTKLINGYRGMSVARREYQSQMVVWKANIDTLVSEVRAEIVRYEKENAGMTAKERDLAKKLIQTREQQLADYQKAIGEKAKQADAEATRKVLEEINSYIKEYGERNDFLIILAATEYGNLAFANDGIDLTEEILGKLNERFPEKSTK